MTPLTPSDFHDRLDSAMPDSDADGALHPAVETDVAAGRRLLRRRRGVTALGAAAAVAVVVGGLALAGGIGDERSRGNDVATPDSEQELLETCRTGNTSAVAVEAIYGSGTPTVKAVARTDQRVVLAVESADGGFWGECSINLAQDAEFHSYLTAYDAGGRTSSQRYASGWDCESTSECRGFSVWVTDRRPEAVAAVEFVTADGEATTVRTIDGYVVFAYAGELAEPISERRMTGGFTALKRITFLDESGAAIAAMATDGSGSGPDGERVGDLPLTSEFPSLRGDSEL